jgi:hypothetical protein
LSEGKKYRKPDLKHFQKIIKEFPNVLYITGKTHPNTITDNVDVYRNSLKALWKIYI